MADDGVRLVKPGTNYEGPLGECRIKSTDTGLDTK
jgi:hypothetical protein